MINILLQFNIQQNMFSIFTSSHRINRTVIFCHRKAKYRILATIISVYRISLGCIFTNTGASYATSFVHDTAIQAIKRKRNHFILLIISSVCFKVTRLKDNEKMDGFIQFMSKLHTILPMLNTSSTFGNTSSTFDKT